MALLSALSCSADQEMPLARARSVTSSRSEFPAPKKTEIEKVACPGQKNVEVGPLPGDEKLEAISSFESEVVEVGIDD